MQVLQCHNFTSQSDCDENRGRNPNRKLLGTNQVACSVRTYTTEAKVVNVRRLPFNLGNKAWDGVVTSIQAVLVVIRIKAFALKAGLEGKGDRAQGSLGPRPFSDIFGMT